ncbi:DUF2637 domain-containing protein [Streptomyces noursei]|uniref:DUF2637 domain-containing protein n=1 Tax=Streptomyces noursei TaxID=1971 RepID=UPI00381263B2
MNRAGKTLLVLALVAVVLLGFRVSWNALRDVAHAIGADTTAATVYPIVVDGLMALALVATLVLVGSSRKFALRVLAGYTVASLVLNYVHGLHGVHARSVEWSRLADWSPANWALVLLATSLPVGSIYFGSDLVAKILHHRPDTTETPAQVPQASAERSTADLEESTPAPADQSASQEAPAEPTPARPTVDLVKHPTTPTTPIEPIRSTPIGTVPTAAAQAPRPRRVTGKVPTAARSKRPTRTPEQLLDEARSATVDWPIEELTAEGIRKAVRCGLEKARPLRDALRAERVDQADPTLDGEAAA